MDIGFADMKYALTICAAALCFAWRGPCEAADSTVAQVPVAEWTRSWWMPRFEAKRALANGGGYDVVFIGDSITQGWEGRGKRVGQERFESPGCRALNCGFDGDRTEHVLWRLLYGQLGSLRPKAFVVMVGTNNTGHHDLQEETPIDTIAGIRAIVRWLADTYPESRVVLHPIFPRGETVRDARRMRNDAVNEKISALADGRRVAWCDFNARLVAEDGSLSKEMMPDLLHPGEEGYRIWADALKPYLDWALGRGPIPSEKAAPMPTAIEPATNAAPANASAGFGWFEDGRYQRKRREIRANASKWFDAVLIGDSITHGWESVGLDDYQRLFSGRTVLNIGFGGDRVQNALWTCGIGGLLDGYRTGLVSVMIGTNNAADSPEDVAAGIAKLLDIVRRKQPDARILLHAIMPRGAKPNALRSKNDKVNALIRRLADGRRVIWVDLGDRLMDEAGNIPKALLYDFLHPTEKGYEIWADALRPHLAETAK